MLQHYEGSCVYADASFLKHVPTKELSQQAHVGDCGRVGNATTQDCWQWSHNVAAAASSPSGQETLLEEGRRRAKDLTGLQHEVQQFWSGPLHSRILSAISKLKRPRSILEIGAFVGISSRVFRSRTMLWCLLILRSFCGTLLQRVLQ